jgi:hypothetical protein
MAKRPALNDTSFLGHLFSPKKNPLPAGIRKTHLSGTRGGRTKARLAAFNRMSPTSQELLRRSGKRESYLKGETSLSEAKASLRQAAVSLGVAKPLPKRKNTGRVTRTALDIKVAAYITETVRNAGRPVNQARVDENVVFIPDDVIGDVPKWDYGHIKYAARKGSEYEIDVEGMKRNGFWYK